MKKLFTLFGASLCLLATGPAFAVTEFILSGATATPIPFLLVDSATGQIGQTGQVSNITVTVQKPGTTSYVASSGTITEVGNGVYNYNPTSAETGGGTTFGPMNIHVTDATDSAQVVDLSVQVIAANLNDATMLGLTNVATLAAQSSQTGTLGTINTNTAATNTTVGTINTNTTATAEATDVQTGMTAQGATSAFFAAAATTNTDAPLIYTAVQALPSSSTIATSVWGAGTRTITGGSLTTAPPTTSQIAAAILSTPADLLFTNSSGYVTATNGGGTGTVSGYANGEDPATLVLGALAASWNTSGTIGYKINNTSSGGGSVTDSSVQTDVTTALSGIGISSGWVTNVATSNTDVPLIYTQTSAANQQANVIAGTEALPSSVTNKKGKYTFNVGTNVLTLYADDGVTVVGTVTLTANGSGIVTSRM